MKLAQLIVGEHAQLVLVLIAGTRLLDVSVADEQSEFLKSAFRRIPLHVQGVLILCILLRNVRGRTMHPQSVDAIPTQVMNIIKLSTFIMISF